MTRHDRPPVPPARRNPASPGQREAARDHVTRLRQDGGTYRSIAAAAALSPAAVRGLASGRRRAQPGTAAAVLTVTSPTAAAGPAGRDRDPAAAARPARDGPRLGPHRPRRHIHPENHPQARPRRRPHRKPPAASRNRRPSRHLVLTPPPPAPPSSAPRLPPPANAPSPGTGAPPPPWTTTCSTPPATGPARAGNPPPAPASPPTSARPTATTGRNGA